MAATDPRSNPDSKLKTINAYVLIGGRVAFSILSWVWIASGIAFFAVIAWITINLWNQGAISETTDLPPIFKWLFGLWGGVQVTGAAALWRPLSYFFKD